MDQNRFDEAREFAVTNSYPTNNIETTHVEYSLGIGEWQYAANICIKYIPQDDTSRWHEMIDLFERYNAITEISIIIPVSVLDKVRAIRIIMWLIENEDGDTIL